MSYQEEFNKLTKGGTYGSGEWAKLTPFTLKYTVSAGGVYLYQYYDFLSRVMTTHVQSSGPALAVVPFTQLDPEVLAAMHRKLVELNGTPPALPAEKGLGKLSL